MFVGGHESILGWVHWTTVWNGKHISTVGSLKIINKLVSKSQKSSKERPEEHCTQVLFDKATRLYVS